jgi:hypothetical protein
MGFVNEHVKYNCIYSADYRGNNNRDINCSVFTVREAIPETTGDKAVFNDFIDFRGIVCVSYCALVQNDPACRRLLRRCCSGLFLPYCVYCSAQ